MRGASQLIAIRGTATAGNTHARRLAELRSIPFVFGLLLVAFSAAWPPSVHAEDAFERTVRSSQPARQQGDVFAVPWYSIDGGGGRSQSLDFEVHGTFGQPDAHLMIGEDFTVKAGFWPSADATNLDLIIFRDGYETFPVTR